MKMKKLVLITGMILISCVLTGSLSAPPPDTAEEISSSSAAQESETHIIREGYVVRDYHGKIAVFKNGKTSPVRVTSTRTDSLPKSDAKKLLEGVDAPDKQALNRILEDYCS